MKFITSSFAVLLLVFNTFSPISTNSIALAQVEARAKKITDYTETQKKLIEYGFEPKGTKRDAFIIRQVQQNLKDLGYYRYKIDGISGTRTRQAIIDFQDDLDLPITGTIDVESTKYIFRSTLILNTQDVPPFHYRINTLNNKAYGPVPEAIRAACLEIKINCLMKYYDDWGEAQNLVKENQAHGMFIIGWNAARAKWLNRSVPIAESEYGFFVRDNDPLDFKEVDSLDQYTVGVFAASNMARTVKKIANTLKSRGLNINVKELEDYKFLFKDLVDSNEKYAVYSNRDIAKTIISGLGLDGIRYAGGHKPILYHVGFSKELVDETIVEQFNQAFMKLKEEGVIQEIYASSGLSAIEEAPVVAKAVEPPKKEDVKPVSRFNLKVANDKEIILDSVTCLVWQQSGSEKEVNWDDAKNYVTTLNQENYAGYSDWRLPKLTELQSLVAADIQKGNRLYIDAVFDAMQQSCWSADGTENDRQFVDFYEGSPASKNQLDTNFVRAVRGTNCQEAPK